jgi:multidrug resistance efflux pump
MIGTIYSNEEQRKLIQLRGQFDVLYAELEFYSAGEKPEDVEKASTRLQLAQQQLETQQRLMERSRSLYQDSLISEQQFELEANEFRLKEISKNVAKAQYRSAITGDKPERAGLIRTKIEVLKQQIEQLRARINYFTLVSPLSLAWWS